MNDHDARPQHAAAVVVSPPRDHALDALRTLAVIGMMAAHTARLMPRDIRPGWASGVLLIEPVIPSLFLLLVGLSLARSFSAAGARGVAPGAWYRRQLKRAAWLWVVSFVFFTLELGVRLPDALLAGGILATIAYAIALVGGLLALGRGIAPVILVLAVGTILFASLDATGLRLHPVNIGNAPFLPLWLFALTGAALGHWFGRSRVMGTVAAEQGSRTETTARRKLMATVGIAAGAVACVLIARYGLEALFSKPFGRSDAGRLVPAPLFTIAETGAATRGGEAVHIGYYNLRPVLAAACLGLQLAALALCGSALSRLPERFAGWAFALGRRALTAYILHLALLASLIVFAGERQPLKTGAHGTLVWLGLIVICHLVSLVRPALRRRNNNVHFRH